ncbi:GmrSD restriction endonuclease domain-containing protein [Chitinophaga pinensis]|uniref:GmrSD restriction endonuclease domain-containing protein n=1 Tax=Chitinophaga pinensis TaxID=79329 RepID=UPI00019E41F4|nr:DUF262 and DUF1524 domain-containing protein [Chitinophaga pinensis]
MKATAASLLAVVKGPKQFVIPVYQRTYSWQRSQCQQLFRDIIKIGGNTASNGHFIGSVVYFQESIYNTTDVPRLLIIDGQQRVTTVSLVILALSEFMKANEVELETNVAKLRNYYLLNPEEEGELGYKLLLTRKDKETYCNLLDGRRPPEDHSLRLTENYEYFKGQITSENASQIYNGLMKLFVVDVTLEKEKDNPQLIFESMNSTGLDLSQADLIRNYILMGQDIDMQQALYENYWYPMEKSFGNEYTTHFDRFVRDYLSAKTNVISNTGAVYADFKTYTSGWLIKDLLAELTKYAAYYANMVLQKEKDASLLAAFKVITILKVDTAYPFLLAVYNDYSRNTIDKIAFLKILDLIISYIFRRAVCGVPTNSLNKTFLTLYKSIDKSDYVDSLAATMCLFEGSKRFPKENEFNREIKIKDLYNFRQKMYFLDKMENYRRKEVVPVNSYTVEHILPQNEELNSDWQEMLGENWREIQKSWLHTLGNLTLTGYNSELSDRSFLYKKKIEGGFNQSPLNLNNYLRKVDVWNEKQIQERAEELANIASAVWRYPKLPEAKLTAVAEVQRAQDSQYSVNNFDALTGDMLRLFEVLRIRILALDESVTEDVKKLYIAYKTSTNFVDIVELLHL